MRIVMNNFKANEVKIPEKTEVVVVGGGVMGTACAYYLTQRGVDVVLYEMRNIASGASGRCGGMVVQLYGRELNIDKTKERLALTQENNRMLLELQEELGDFEFRIRGCLDVFVEEKEVEEGKRLYEIQRKLGDDEIELLDAKQTTEIMPSLPDNILGSRYRASDGNLNPFKFCQVTAKAAKKLGALIFTHTKVEEILEDSSVVKGVRIPFGVTQARWVVNATNGWASKLTPEVAITPVRQLAMATERVPGLKCCPFEVPAPGYYAWGTTQAKSGNIVVGGPGPLEKERFKEMDDHFDEMVSLSEAIECANYLKVLMPKVKEVNIIRIWAGAMGFSQDGIPNIGFVPEKEGLIIAAGFAAGMSQGAVVGRIVADLIAEGDTPFPMEVYDPKRFLGKKVEWPAQPYDLGILHEFFARRQKEEIN